MQLALRTYLPIKKMKRINHESHLLTRVFYLIGAAAIISYNILANFDQNINFSLVSKSSLNITPQNDAKHRKLVASSTSGSSVKQPTSKIEPSHIQMCRAILEPSSEKRILIEEHPEVCHNLDKPHLSLLQIFASELISEIARIYNKKVWYRHHCFPPPLPTIEEWLKHVFPIQEFLPSPLLTTDFRDQNQVMSIQRLTDICHECINLFEAKGDSSPGCVLFSKKQKKSSSDKDEPMGIQMMIPSIQKNLKYASNLWSIQKNVPLIEESRNKGILYLNCRRDRCTSDDTPGSIAVDFLAYFLQIPVHLHEIDVIAPKSCGTICEEKGKQVLHLMTSLYPSSLVLFHMEESSAALYSRMMAAGYLICTHTETCLIPAIAQGGMVDKYTSLNVDPNRKDSLWMSLLSNDNSDENLIAASRKKDILSPNIHFEYEKELLMIGQNGNCRHVRGRFGKWTEDLSLAPSLQYRGQKLNNIYGFAANSFKATDMKRFRQPTTYKWISSFFPGCHVNDIIIRPSFCHVWKKMEIQRIFLIGDSSVHSQAMSLWKVLGNGIDPYTNNDARNYPNFKQEMECPGGNVEIVYIRNDNLIEPDDDIPVSYPEGIRNCGTIGFCYPWIGRYLSSPVKTLLISSMGATINTDEEFQHHFDAFIRTVDSFHRPDDILIFRTNHPDHENCHVPASPTHPKPLENYQQYLKFRASPSKVEGFNEYIHHFTTKRNIEQLKETSTPKKMRMEVLDIYPMTVLRNDAHLGGEECVKATCNENAAMRDCYHYFLPGPVDWWNHLLYNNLMDIGLNQHAYTSHVVEALKHPPS